MSKGVAIVTGAAQGIGRAIAVQLGIDGFDVAVNDVASKLALLDALSKEINDSGRRSIVIPGDVASEAEVQAMVSEVVAKLGSLDVMIANAGIYHRNLFVDTPVEEYDRIMAVNARGPMLCYKHAARQMIAQGRGGRIIGAASIASKRPFIGGTSYAMSKFAVQALTQVAAMELGEHNITVNAYAPGATLTPMMEREMELAPGEQIEQIEQMLKAVPIKRVGQPEDVANLVSFLASDKAGYITGQTYSVDGGMVPS